MPFKEGDFYKLVGPDGRDLYSGQDDYTKLVGWTLYKTNPVSEGPFVGICSSDVLHASRNLIDATKIMQRGRTSMFRVFRVFGKPVTSAPGYAKHGFREYDVIEELDADGIRDRLTYELRKGYWDGYRVVQFTAQILYHWERQYYVFHTTTCPNCSHVIPGVMKP